MTARALFRLPYSDTYTIVEQGSGHPEELAAYGALDGREGFVIAPFAITAAEPLLLLRPDRIETRRTTSETEVAGRARRKHEADATDRRAYAGDFARCHSQLLAGRFAKLVLARRATERMARRVDAEQLFMRACRLYPRMFVALVEAQRCGTWLFATPERLLSGTSDRWHTVALAGTQRLDGDAARFDCPPKPHAPADETIAWDGKNRREQRIVADYIADTLRPLTTGLSRSEARTVRAGNVIHLRTDFDFTLADGQGIGNVINALHPTPAVCGLPKDEARRFLTTAEHSPRSYYSGFMGPLNICNETHLYVSLRCMAIDGDSCSLYAGGGLLTDSIEEQEWLETEAKMETMRNVIGDTVTDE